MYQIGWLFDRWRIMQHPYEEFYRVRQFWQYYYIDRRWAKRPPVDRNAAMAWNGLMCGYYSVNDIERIVNQTFDNVNEFKILNVVVPDIVSHVDWNYDAKNQHVCARRFVHEINDFDYSYGEVKYVYELSRLYQFVPLIAYYIAHDDKAGIASLKKTLQDWFEQNPFLYNVAWKSGNVVGIRAVNLIIFKSLLDMVDRDDEFERFFADLMALHYKFLRSHLSLYSSKGNHHIGELAGLIAIAAAFDFKHSEQHLHKYIDELQGEVLRLIYPDGMNKEQAVRYQASYINLIMMSLMFAERKGYRVEDSVINRMKAAYEFLAAMKVRHGCFFNVGDNDDAQLIYPYPDKDFDIYESMLNDYALRYGVAVDEEYHFDLRNYVLLGIQGAKRYEQSIKRKFVPSIKAHLYKESGYYVYSDDKLNLLFDVGRIGLLPTMSHGHSDMLSFQIYYKGIPVLVDTGAYQYNLKYRKLRDYFHGVHSHNTIAVNGKDQAILGSGMFWMSNPSVRIEEYSENGSQPHCTACHDGYVRKDMNVLHHRSVAVRNGDVVVEDNIEGSGAEYFRFYLHFHPAIDVALESEKLLVMYRDTLIMQIENKLFNQGRLVRGDAETPMGWYSPSYDNIEPTTSFVLECSLSEKQQIETIIHCM